MTHISRGMTRRKFLSKTDFGDLRFIMIDGTASTSAGQLNKSWFGYVMDSPEDKGTVRAEKTFMFRQVDELIGFRVYFSEVVDVV